MSKSRTKVGPGIYRYHAKGNYVAIFKKDGKQFYEDLKAFDLPEARRKATEYRRSLERLKHESRNMRLDDASKIYLTKIQNQEKQTIVGKTGILKKVSEVWAGNPKMSDIRPSHCIALLESYKGQSRHRQALHVLRELFEISIDEGAISSSPVQKMKQRKKITAPKLIPTEEQFRAIVENIRNRRGGEQIQESADFVEACGLFGLGQAEISNLSRKDINLETRRVNVLRKKTKHPFVSLITEECAEFIARKLNAMEDKNLNAKIFKFKNSHWAFNTAIEKLGFPHFTLRSLRRTFIKRMIDKNIQPKIIGRTQGHQDGGVLILKTYSEFFETEDYDNALAKLAN